MNILLIADVGEQSDHSAVEGLFITDPANGIACTKVFFTKERNASHDQSDRLVLPYANRRRGLAAALKSAMDLQQFDVVIVRNLFNVLEQMHRAGLTARIGFWESFPHSYRRLEQAYFEKRAIVRKRIEYYFAARRERRLIETCDFYLPITETHKSIFYPDLKIPCHATPMGFDFARHPIQPPTPKQGPIHFVYIGAVDKLRRLDIINQAFMAQQRPFRLDYFSSSRNGVVDDIRRLNDPRIRVQLVIVRHPRHIRLEHEDQIRFFQPRCRLVSEVVGVVAGKRKIARAVRTNAGCGRLGELGEDRHVSRPCAVARGNAKHPLGIVNRLGESAQLALGRNPVLGGG